MEYVENSFSLDGIPVRFIEAGSGFPVLLIHGSGPGASTEGNWRSVLEPMAARYHVFATDLIGFGKSGRKPSPPFFDLELWLRQCRALIEKMPGERIGVVGHSLAGALALKLAATESRISAVLTTATLGVSFKVNEDSVRTWTFPQNRDEMRRAAEGLIYDKRLIDEDYLAHRESILRKDDYGQYFSAMFAGEKQRFVDAAVLSDDELRRIVCRVTMLHGRDDRGFPDKDLTLRISENLRQADVILIAKCSHSIAMEHPTKLLAAATLLFETR